LIGFQFVDPAEAFEAYLSVQHRLPPATGGGRALNASFADIVAPFDLILFDAYGVLNVGETPSRQIRRRRVQLRRLSESPDDDALCRARL
jgi:hypothetical protein